MEALYRTMEERFHALPGVVKVGISSYTPMEDDNNSWSVQVQGQPDPHTSSSVVRVNPEYFDSVGTRVVMGRGIGVQDTPASPTVAVVNQTFVKKLFKPGENPIGAHFGGGMKSAGDYEIVGVVEDTAYTSVRWKDHLMYFVPLMQRPASDKDPIEKDDSLYAGGDCAADGSADQRYGVAGADDAGEHQSEPVGSEVSDLRRADFRSVQ